MKGVKPEADFFIDVHGNVFQPQQKHSTTLRREIRKRLTVKLRHLLNEQANRKEELTQLVNVALANENLL